MEQNQQQEQMSVKPWLWILMGAAIGGTVAYLLDPSAGRHRRAVIRDKSMHLARESASSGTKMYRNLKNHAVGAVAKVSGRLQAENVDDVTLMNRVRSKFGRVVHHAKAIDVEVHDGEVTLMGTIAPNELNSFLKTVKRVPGVKGVVNHLDIATSG